MMFVLIYNKYKHDKYVLMFFMPGRHDIAEILLKVALNTKNQIKPNDEKAARFVGDGVNIYNGNP
jgi:hypothetical protein